LCFHYFDHAARVALPEIAKVLPIDPTLGGAEPSELVLS